MRNRASGSIEQDQRIADFHADWIEMLRRELAAAGYPAAANEDADAIRIRYFNLQHRFIPVQPRRVRPADTLRVPEAHVEAFDAIQGKIERGESLTPHLSRTLTDLGYNDLMLNDWGIHHLHLSTTVEADGFTRRTGDVLLARFIEDTAYLIAIGGHGSWADSSLLEIVLRNWPHLLETCVLKSVLAARPGFTDSERQELRKAGALTSIELSDGKVYLGMGGMYATDGSSVRAKRWAARWSRTVRNLEKWIRQNLATLQARAQKELPAQPQFELVEVVSDEKEARFRVMERCTEEVFEFPIRH